MAHDWRARLRAAIDATGRNHWYIAEEAGIDPATLSRILTGRMNPRFDIVVRLARASGVAVAWLLGEEGFEFSERDQATLAHAAAILRAMSMRK